MQDDTTSPPAAPAMPDETEAPESATTAADDANDTPTLHVESSAPAEQPPTLPASEDGETTQATAAEDAAAAVIDVSPAPAAPEAAVGDMSPAACGARLVELFPALFAQGAPHGPMKPLKLRIQPDLQQRAPGVFSRRTLGIFFSRYTTGNAYLKALTLAPHRFDLDGQPAGEIAEEHRQAATEELARRHALAAERRASQPPPRRELPPAEGASGPDATHQPRPERQPGPRPDRPQPRRDQRPDARPPRPQRSGDHAPRTQRPPRPELAPPMHAAPAPAALPADPAQRERALLLRAFESSPLSKANFCALKGISEAALDAAMAGASAERAGR